MSSLSCQKAFQATLKMALLAGILLGGIFTAKGQENPDSDAQSELFHGSHLPSDREAGRRLHLADELIAERRYSDAVRFLDDILAAPEDFFDANGESRKRSALDRLLALPSGGQRAYALLLQSQRDRELNSASKNEMAELAARFPPELLGTPVWRAWAAAESEQGHYAHAVQLLREIVSVSEGEEASRADDSLSLAIQLARTGQQDAAVQVLEKSGDAKPEETITQLLGATHTAQQHWSATRSPNAWLSAEGDAVRNPRVPGGAPLAWRRWRASLVSSASDALRLARRSEAVAQAPRLAAQNVVAVDGKIIASTADQLIAVDAETGKRLWSAPRRSLRGSEAMVGDSPGVALLDPAVERAWLDRVRGGISSDGRRVLAVGESASSVSADRYSSRFGHFRGQVTPPTNALKAYDIVAQGKLAWTLDGSEKGGPVEGAFFLGPPVASEGRLMTLAQIDQTICFLLIEAATGEVMWRQSLVTLERGVEDNESLRLIGAMPTVAGDLVVCPTGVGVVVAVDPNRRTLAWAHRLPVEAERLENVRRHDWRRFSSNFDIAWRQKPGWRETRAISTGDRLLVVSPESDRLHCLDLATGKAVWSKPISQGLAFGAVTLLPQEPMVILVEADAISARDVATGQQRWRIATPPGDLPAGAGLLVGDHFLLPLSSGRLAAVPLTRAKPVMKWIDLGPDPFDTPAEGGALGYHRGAIYVRTGTALARYDQQQPVDGPSGAESKARLAARLVRQAQADPAAVPSVTEQLAELVKHRAGRRRMAILQIEAAAERHDLPAAIAATFALATLEPTGAVVESNSGNRVAADRWASARLARLARLGETTHVDDQQLLRSYAAHKTDLATSKALIGLFEFVPSFVAQVVDKLDVEQRNALGDRLALLMPGKPNPPPRMTSGAWAKHQAIAALSIIETPAETKQRSHVFRHRQTPKENQRLLLRQTGWQTGLGQRSFDESVPHEWRLVGQLSEARHLLGTSADGERLTSLHLSDAMNATVRQQGVGRPGHWQWGPYLILSIEGQVGVYDVRPGIASDERLCWTTSTNNMPPQVIRLHDGKVSHAPLAKEGPAQILWVGPKGVVLQQGNQLECRDLLTGRPLWQRPFPRIEQTLGDDRQLYVATSNRSGKVLSLVDGTTVSQWKPPRGEWRVAQGTRLLVTHENENRIFDFSIDSKSPVWNQSFAPGTLFTRIGDHRFATLNPEGELSLFDLQATSLEGGPQFKTPLENATKPKSLHAYGLGERLLVIVNEIGAEEHRTQGRLSLSNKPLVTGKAYCLDRSTGVPLWQSPASLEGEALLPATISDSPVVFFGSRQNVSGVSDAAATRNRLVVIDMASGRTVYRNDSLPTGGNADFWVQRESTPSPRLLVSLGPARLRLDLTSARSSPSPPYQAIVERRDPSRGSSLSGIGRDLGRLFQSMITPDSESDEEK